MEPVTITLFILSGISFLLHGFHLGGKYRCGSSASCCQCAGDIDETPSPNSSGSCGSQKIALDVIKS
jgi:hypothetical protein